MLLIRSLGCALLGLALATVALEAGGKNKKDAKTESKSLVIGILKDVDAKGSAFTITTADKKDRTFQVNKETKFTGPEGGKGKGLKDDRMVKGYEVKVEPAADPKIAKEVLLPYRKKAATKGK